MSKLSDAFEQRPVGAIHSSIRSRKQTRFPSGPQYTESALESAVIDQLCFSPFVRDLITQAIVRFDHDTEKRQYSADVFVEYSLPDQGTERFMIEVKRQQEIEENADRNKLRFDAAMRWCSDNDACFCLLSEEDIKTVYLANVRKLAEAATTALSAPARKAILDLVGTSTVSQAQKTLVARGVDAATAIIAIEKAVVDRDLDCDLTKPFSTNTLVGPGLSRASSPERSDPFLKILRSAARRSRR